MARIEHEQLFLIPLDEHRQWFTRRESEILALIAAAGSNQQVADHLGISVRTVRAHLRSIYRKIGVTSRVGAARYALNR